MIMFQTQDTVFVKFSWKDCSYESYISKAEVPFDNWSVSQFDDDHREMFLEREKRRNEILTKISSLRYTLIALLSWSLTWFLNTRIEMRHTSIPFLTTCMDRSCSNPLRSAGKLDKASHQDFQRRYYCRCAHQICVFLYQNSTRKPWGSCLLEKNEEGCLEAANLIRFRRWSSDHACRAAHPTFRKQFCGQCLKITKYQVALHGHDHEDQS